MKKFLALIMAMFMIAFCFVACDVEDNESDVTTTEGIEGDNTPDDKKVLKMGTNAYFKPYEYYEGEDIVGIDAEIAKAIADYL